MFWVCLVFFDCSVLFCFIFLLCFAVTEADMMKVLEKEENLWTQEHNQKMETEQDEETAFEALGQMMRESVVDPDLHKLKPTCQSCTRSFPPGYICNKKG